MLAGSSGKPEHQPEPGCSPVARRITQPGPRQALWQVPRQVAARCLYMDSVWFITRLHPFSDLGGWGCPADAQSNMFAKRFR
eukprot:1882348-Heterocapsa_arctica.AAC.1